MRSCLNSSLVWGTLLTRKRRTTNQLVALIPSVVPTLIVCVVVLFSSLLNVVVSQVSVHPIARRIVAVVFSGIFLTLVVMILKFFGTIFRHHGALLAPDC